MQNRINWLGIVCALLLPALGILNRDNATLTMLVGKLAPVWGISSVFLLLVWFLNLRLSAALRPQTQLTTSMRTGIIIGCDLGLIGLFILLKTSSWLPAAFYDDMMANSQLFIRLGIASLLIIMIQYSFLSTIQQEVLNRQNEQLRSENLVAQLEGLKQQINPHFLFNSLGTLRAMIHEKDENAEQFVLSLSAVYRQFLSKHHETTTTLPEELEFLESYLFMLRFRYEDRLRLTIDVQSQTTPDRLPIFCLQLLVENCIKHNILSAAKPLSVRIYLDGPASVTVENNKQLKRSGIDSTGIGLDNLCKRYELLGVPDAVTIRETDTTFAISVALLEP